MTEPDTTADRSMSACEERLHRGLRARHMQMLAIGMTVGVGLFLGSGEGIHVAGPALLMSYAFAGMVMFCLMRALGEMAVHSPEVGSFAEYAFRYIGPLAGFLTGWTYWLLCVLSPMVGLTACGIYVRYWLPSVPQWISALVGLVLLVVVQWAPVKLFGELEFWFALIKVVAIVSVIVLGLGIILTGMTSLGDDASVANIWRFGGFFPMGWRGVLLTLQIAIFAFGGVEMLGVTAGEAAEPERAIPRAVRGVIRRIIFLYIGALTVLVMLQPWNRYTADVSPFVAVLTGAGLVSAAGVMNVVVLASALSSCNATMFAASRMLFGLSRSGSAPRGLRRVSARRVPVVAVAVTALAVGTGVLVNYVAPEQAFTTLISVVSVSGLWAWAIIAYSHLRFCRRLRAEGRPRPTFRLPAAPWTNLIVIVAVGGVAASLAFSAEGRTGLYSGGVWWMILTITYLIRRRTGRTSGGWQTELPGRSTRPG